MTYDREQFFFDFRQNFGPLVQTQVDGLNFILGRAESDANWQNLSQLAYGLATVKWETAHHFVPVTEFGKREYFKRYDPGAASGQALGNTEPGDGYLFRGRGYVQITGRANYERIGRLLNIDLIGEPWRALDPETAYRIFSDGMTHGWFTGKKLSDYIASDQEAHFESARAIINGLDHAADIAAIARSMRTILQACPAVLTVPDNVTVEKREEI